MSEIKLNLQALQKKPEKEDTTDVHPDDQHLDTKPSEAEKKSENQIGEVPKIDIQIDVEDSEKDTEADIQTSIENNTDKQGVQKDLESNIDTNNKEVIDDKQNDESKEEKESSHIIGLDSINKYVEKTDKQTQKDEKEEQEDQDVTQKTLQKKKDEKKHSVNFSNYNSYFDNESKNIFNKIRNFRYAPKTRLGLIMVLIGITGCVIGSLMILAPDKHSFSYYKASIISLYNGEEIPVNTNDDIFDLGDSSLPVSTPISEDNTQNQNENSDEKNTDTPINRDEERRNKLREHLLERYSS